MDEIKTLFSGERLVAVMCLAPLLCGAIAGIAVTIAAQWRKARQAESDAALKRDMLARGMSADDIVKVLAAATTPPQHRVATGASGHDVGSPEGLAAELAGTDTPADQIVTLLKAASTPAKRHLAAELDGTGMLAPDIIKVLDALGTATPPGLVAGVADAGPSLREQPKAI